MGLRRNNIQKQIFGSLEVWCFCLSTYVLRRNSIQKRISNLPADLRKIKNLFLSTHVLQRNTIKRYRRTFILVFYVHEEQYKKDIKSSTGSLEDQKSFSFVELSYLFSMYTSPRCQLESTLLQKLNTHHNNKQQNAQTTTHTPIQWQAQPKLLEEVLLLGA